MTVTDQPEGPGQPSRSPHQVSLGESCVAAEDMEWAALPDTPLAQFNLDELLQRTVERVRKAMGADGAYVLLPTDDEGEFEIRAVIGLPRSVRQFTRLPVQARSGQLGSSLPVVYEDIQALPGAVPLLTGTDIRAVASIPLVVEARVTGYLGIVAKQPRCFTYDDTIRLQRAINRITLSVENARLAESYRVRRGWLSFLAEASDLLAGTLDHEQTLALVAQLVTPRLATWCAVYSVDETRVARLAYVWHEDETKVDALRAALEHTPPPDPRMLSNGQPWQGPDSAGSARIAEHRDQSNEAPIKPDDDFGVLSDTIVAFPLIARRHALGALLLGRERGDEFRRDVLDLADDLSRRAALALDNARLYSERTAISKALQRSLLPPELPEVPGLDVAVIYQAAGEGNDVGGDFYDLFPITVDRWGFAIGDVCGRGAQAAAVTGLARHALRILGREGHSVPIVLDRLNAAILDEGARARFLTLLYGEISSRPRKPGENQDESRAHGKSSNHAAHTSGGLRITFVSAGHPLPLRLRSTGEVESIGTPQTLLGVIEDLDLVAETIDLDPGDVLLCVTDGAIERRHDQHMLGEEGLAAALAKYGELTAAAVAHRIQQVVVNFAPKAPKDDMAILVLRVL